MIFAHEMRRARVSCAVWAASIAAMVAVCLFIYPDMAKQMGSISKLFAGMGMFTKAFGLDSIDFASPMGFYGIECGNILGICGALFAAFTGAGALSREETGRTAEFLLTHPVSRARVAAGKLMACIAQTAIVNAAAALVALGCFAAIGESIDFSVFCQLHGAMLMAQIEIACLCFAVSAAAKRAAIGAGIGIMAVMYFLGIISNISESAAFARYITPFAYADAARIISGGPDAVKILLGAAYSLAAAAFGAVYFMKKDISA